MKVGKFLKSITAVLAFCGVMASASAGVIKTDIIFVVDESGSMSSVQSNLINNIGLFASILNAGGVQGQYGLVGYGNTNQAPRTLSALTDPTTFAANAASLVASGGFEAAYDAIGYALNSANHYNAGGSFAFRNDAVTNIIMLTDEDADWFAETSLTWGDADALLKANNALFNIVTDSDGNNIQNGGTLNGLATANGGNTFDLSQFASSNQQTVENFVLDFANAKLQETIDFCTANPNDPACKNVTIPEPASIALLSLGLLGFATRRKVQK